MYNETANNLYFRQKKTGREGKMFGENAQMYVLVVGLTVMVVTLFVLLFLQSSYIRGKIAHFEIYDSVSNDDPKFKCMYDSKNVVQAFAIKASMTTTQTLSGSVPVVLDDLYTSCEASDKGKYKTQAVPIREARWLAVYTDVNAKRLLTQVGSGALRYIMVRNFFLRIMVDPAQRASNESLTYFIIYGLPDIPTECSSSMLLPIQNCVGDNGDADRVLYELKEQADETGSDEILIHLWAYGTQK